MAAVVSWSWDYGDGTPPFQGEDSPPHRYLEAGVYTVTRTVFFDNGTNTSVSYQIVANAFNFAAIAPDSVPVIYRFGRTKEEGLGASLISGWSFPVQTAGLNALRIIDKAGIARFVAFDNNDRKFYEITTVGGADGLNRKVVWRDKADINGEGGVEYKSGIEFRAVSGTYERQFLEMKSANIYTRPVKRRRRGIGVEFSDNGYPVGFSADVSVVADEGNISSSKSLGVNMPKQEIHFDKRVEGLLLQLKFTGNSAPHTVTGMDSNVILKDKLDAPQNRVQSEDEWQDTLSDVVHWITRGSEPDVDRVTGVLEPTINAAGELIVGPDGYDDSAIEILAAESYSVSGVDDLRVLFFYRSGTDTGSLPVGTTTITTLGDWVFAEAVGLSLTFGEGYFFDIRTYIDGELPADFDEGARTYLFNDISDYNGKLTLPAWI